MEYFFDLLMVIFRFGFVLFCNFIVYVLAWGAVFIAFALAIFPVYFLLDYIVCKTPARYEHIAKYKTRITNLEDSIAKKLIIFSGVLCLPIMIVGGEKTVDTITGKISENRPHEVVVETEIRQFRLLELSSPKHVYAKFEDVSAKLIYSKIYVGTYCPGKPDRVGDLYNIKTTRYYMSDVPDKKYVRFENLQGVFCE